MRTNIVLNEDLIEEAGRYSHARSKRALVEEALRTYVEVKSREHREENYRERVRKLDKKLSELVLRERPSRVLKADRNRA